MKKMIEEIKGILSNFEEESATYIYEMARKAIRKQSGIEPSGMRWNKECIPINIWDDFNEGEDTSIFIEDGGMSEERQGEILEYIIEYLRGKKRRGDRRINVPGSFGLDKGRRKINWQGGDPTYCRELVRRMNDIRLEWMGWDLVFYSES